MLIKLNDLTTLITKGTTPTTIGCNFTKSGVNFIKVESISNNGTLDKNYFSYIDIETHNKMKRSQLNYLDLVISIAGNLGRVAVIEKNDLPTNTNQAVGIIRLNHNLCNVYYLKYLFQTTKYQKLFLNSNAQSIQKNINLDNLANIEIDLPTREIQNKIANILSDIDNQIERNNAMTKRLQVMAQTTYSRWFNQFEFPDNDGKSYKSNGGKMVWNKVIKKEIPEGWFVKSLCNDGICDFFKGKTPSKLSSEKKENYEKYLTLDSISNTNLQYCEKYNMPVCNGYTIMVMDGAASGDVYVQKYGIVGSTFAMLVPKQTEYNLNNFIYLYLSENKPIYIKTNTGSTIPHANRKFIENMNVLIPNNFELFLNTINPIFEQIHSIDNVNFELVQLKEKLLPLLINGQLNF